MGEYDLYILAHKVDRCIKRSLGHVLLDQIEKSVLRFVCRTVEIEGESLFQVRIVLHHRLDDVHMECIAHKQVVVRDESYHCSVLFLGRPLT